ncbi:MAG: hypothetical protein ACJ746_31795 [Bryobacteraceae bacterium]
MRRFIISTVVTAALLSGIAAFACGDKLLAIGRGVRFQRLYAARKANLLIYSVGARSGADLDSARLQISLKRAVHNLQLVRDRSQLDGALASGQADVVLVQFTDLAAIARQLRSSPSRPVILPVLFKPSKADFAAAEKEYKFALKADADELEYLTAIDKAMQVRSKAGAKS